MYIEPYPVDWPRKLDFLPPLGLQVALDKNLITYYLDATLTIQTGKIRADEKTELGGMLKVDETAGKRIHYEIGHPDPRVGASRIPQREILEDIKRYDIDIPDIVIKLRGIEHDIPSTVQSFDSLQGSEKIWRQEYASGNNVPKYRRTLRLDIENPYPYIKADLLIQKIIKRPNDPVLRKLRSVLKTDWIFSDKKGYFDLHNDLIPIENALIGNNWWQDIGFPLPFQGTIDHRLIKGQLYHLQRRKWCTVI